MTSKDIVSKDVAKLLKKRGFTEQTYWYYLVRGEASNYGYDFNHNKFDSEYSAPSLQEAHKWLKNTHQILVTVVPCEIHIGFQMLAYNIYNITRTNFEPIYQCCPWENGKIEYEEVMNDGIKYVLENIIK